MQNETQSTAFGRLLQEYRLRAGLTQETLAEVAGLGRRSIQGLERGENIPHRETLQRLILALALSPTDRDRLEATAQPSRRRRPADSYQPPRLLPGAYPETTPRHNLPVEPTPLIGRANESVAIRDLLSHDHVRLVTLTGPPGIGKTSLGQRVLFEMLDRFPDGVILVSLATIRDAELVLPTVAHALDVHESVGRSLLDGLRTSLLGKKLLLMLDNFEQLIAAATVVADLLALTPGLKILVTSREVLRLRGEHSFLVPPLSLPDLRFPARPDDLLRSDAVRLFITRAKAAKSNFSLTSENAAAVAAICRTLDGIPLAIELAAARVRLLSPQAILPRLNSRLRLLTDGPRDLPAHQQTLRGAIDWSYELLDEAERLLFRRLAVFAGSFTIEAAESVCSGDGPVTSVVLDQLVHLVEKSLVVVEYEEAMARYRMLETIREYAAERLVEATEEHEIQDRYADWLVTLTEQAESGLHGPDRLSWLERLEAEFDNLRAVLRTAVEFDQAERGLRIANALHWFWLERHVTEGRAWLLALLATPSASKTTNVRAKALATAGALAGVQGEIGVARRLLDESIAIGSKFEDASAICLALLGMATVLRSQGEFAEARSRLEQSLALAHQSGDPWTVAHSLFLLAELTAGQGDYVAARPGFEDSLTQFRDVGDRWGIAHALRAVGSVAYGQGQYDLARLHFDESLTIGREIADPVLIAWSLWGIGVVAYASGDYATARESFRQSVAIFQNRDERGAIALVLGGLAALAAAKGEAERALRIAASATRLRQRIGAQLLPSDQADLISWLKPARQTLSNAAQQEASARGEAMSLDQAIAYALADDMG